MSVGKPRKQDRAEVVRLKETLIHIKQNKGETTETG